MTLDRATAAFVAKASASGRKRLHQMTPAQAREQSDAGMAALMPGPEMVSVTECTIGRATLRVYRPTTEPTGVVVYFHGGGWVVGSLDGYDTVCRILADRSDCTVVSVGYRLAPESRYPAAVDDAWCAAVWADGHRDDFACVGAPLIVVGDSAGGNLAAVVAQRAAERLHPTIDLQVLIYPVTDCDFDRPSYLADDNQVLLDRASMMWCWDRYVPDAGDRRCPDASPLRRADVSAVASAVVVLAEHDVLRDEGHLYAEKMRRQGVSVDEVVVTGQTHGFFQFPGLLPGASMGMDHVVDAITRARSLDNPPVQRTRR